MQEKQVFSIENPRLYAITARCLRDRLASAASRSTIFPILMFGSERRGLWSNLPAHSSLIIDRAKLGNKGRHKQGTGRSAA